MKQQFYQGDLIIEIHGEIPKGVSLKPLVNGGIVVAEGEATGHRHTLVADKNSEVLVGWTEAGELVFQVSKGTATLTHQEHAAHTYGVGIGVIRRQVEYDEVGERKVID